MTNREDLIERIGNIIPESLVNISEHYNLCDDIAKEMKKMQEEINELKVTNGILIAVLEAQTQAWLQQFKRE